MSFMQPLGNRIAHLVGKLPQTVQTYLWQMVNNNEVCVFVCMFVCVCV